MRGGRRLWQSRDERKWGHDKYEEMNTHEKQYDVVNLVLSLSHLCINILTFSSVVYTSATSFIFPFNLKADR